MLTSCMDCIAGRKNAMDKLYPRGTSRATRPLAQNFLTRSAPVEVLSAIIMLWVAEGTGMDVPVNAASPLSTTNIVRSFSARGVVRAVAVAESKVEISHDAIPGFMPKMTMEFTARDSNQLRGLQTGDQITFLVKATEEESWIEGIQKQGAATPMKGPPPQPLRSLAHVAELKPGDLLPEVTLKGEDGRTLRLSDFRGSAVAFTFIFTRCPLPDFCPRMNLRFRQARDLLLAQTNGPGNWQFVSISFDLE